MNSQIFFAGLLLTSIAFSADLNFRDGYVCKPKQSEQTAYLEEKKRANMVYPHYVNPGILKLSFADLVIKKTGAFYRVIRFSFFDESGEQKVGSDLDIALHSYTGTILERYTSVDVLKLPRGVVSASAINYNRSEDGRKTEMNLKVQSGGLIFESIYDCQM